MICFEFIKNRGYENRSKKWTFGLKTIEQKIPIKETPSIILNSCYYKHERQRSIRKLIRRREGLRRLSEWKSETSAEDKATKMTMRRAKIKSQSGGASDWVSKDARHLNKQQHIKKSWKLSMSYPSIFANFLIEISYTYFGIFKHFNSDV